MKKFLVAMLCVAMCGAAMFTSCAPVEEDSKKSTKKEKIVKQLDPGQEVELNLKSEYEKKVGVFEYKFSKKNGVATATLIGYHPENAAEGEVVESEIVLPENPIGTQKGIKKTKTTFNGYKLKIEEYVDVEDTTTTYTLVGIDAGVFAGQEHITKVIIPDTVEEIGTGAFQGCTALKEVHLPENENFEIIEKFMFNGCTSLETLNIPGSVQTIGIFAFGDYFAKCPWYENLSGSSVIVGDGVLLKYNGASDTVAYGDEVKSIAYYAFTDTAIKNVTFTNALVDLSEIAFYRASGVTVKIPFDNEFVSFLKTQSNLSVVTYDGGSSNKAPVAEVPAEETPSEEANAEEVPVEEANA